MSQRVALYTLGCKLNYSESSSIGRLFTEAGYQKVEFQEGADIYVINTCSVTDHADKKCRKVVKEALRYSPNARVVVIGCYAQLKPQKIAEIPGVNLVLGAAEKFQLLEYVQQLEQDGGKAIVKQQEIAAASHFVSSYSHGDRTRSFLKVQDGCDYSCSFCTIPLARGESRSDTIAHVIQQAERIVAEGYKEIVLTGVNIGDFSTNDGETFYDLVQALDQVNGLDRIRISSIEPNLLSDEIIRFVAGSKKFVPHFHIPLQSGNDAILAKMRRRYKRSLYADRVQLIKELMPHACIGVDVIVGFPGESREDFLVTYDFINSLDISYLHVFTYSQRENTPAATMPKQVPGADKADRNKMLQILSEKKRRQFYEQELGTEQIVLFEADQKDGFMHGFTRNYVKVKAKYDPLLVNELVPVRLMAIDADGEVTVEQLEEILHHS